MNHFCATRNRLPRRLDRDARTFLGNRDGWMPALDIEQDQKGLRLRMDLPGVNPEQIRIQVEGDLLSVSGAREDLSEKNEARLSYSERRQGRFERRLRMSDKLDTQAIRAEYRHGVLTLTAPLRKEAQPREIKVSMN